MGASKDKPQKQHGGELGAEETVPDLEVTDPEAADQVRGGETVQIPAARVPKFSAGSALRNIRERLAEDTRSKEVGDGEPGRERAIRSRSTLIDDIEVAEGDAEGIVGGGKAKKDPPVEYLKVKMDEVIITGVSE